MDRKVAVDCRLYSQKATGISRYTLVFLKFVVNKFGAINTVVITNERIPGFDHCQQVVTNYKPFNLAHFFVFPRLVKNLNVDLYISFHYSGLAYKVYGVKSLITVHDLMYKLVPGFFGNQLKDAIGKVYYNILVGLSISTSDIVMTVSETSKNDILRCFNRDSINSSEGVFFSAKPDLDILNKYDLIEREYFFYAGNNRPHKNVKLLIDAFESSEAKNDGVKLVIVGHSGTSNDTIIYPGFVSDEELAGLYTGARAFVFPSLYEGFGLPILESIMYGTPVVASDISAFREFKTQNIRFFKNSSKQDLVQVLDQPHTFDAKDAKEFLSEYQWEVIERRFEQLLESFV
ncbi:glycosyltransferase family 4 protein [Vibrio cidicii]|uniref:glycosyltransferase family 4 protein n=1 Tax=Vibrio cidicii TaxID=1763883 RepID=UPI003F514F12